MKPIVFPLGHLYHGITIKLQTLCYHPDYLFRPAWVGVVSLTPKISFCWSNRVSFIPISVRFPARCPMPSPADSCAAAGGGELCAIGWSLPSLRLHRTTQVPARASLLPCSAQHPARVTPPIPCEESCLSDFGALAKSLSSLITDHC